MVEWKGRIGQCIVRADHEPHIVSYTMTPRGPENITFCPGINPVARIVKCTNSELRFEPPKERNGYAD